MKYLPHIVAVMMVFCAIVNSTEIGVLANGKIFFHFELDEEFCEGIWKAFRAFQILNLLVGRLLKERYSKRSKSPPPHKSGGVFLWK